MNNNYKFSWGHLFATLAGVVVTVVTPNVQHFIGGHPLVSSIFAGVWAALGVFLTPPQGK